MEENFNQQFTPVTPGSEPPTASPENTTKNKHPWLKTVIMASVLVLFLGTVTFGWYSYQVYQGKYASNFLPVVSNLKPELPDPENGVNSTNLNNTSPSSSQPASDQASNGQNSNKSATKSRQSTGSGDSSDDASSDNSTRASTLTINDNSVQLTEKSSGHCKTLAPNDWAIACNQDSTGADVYSPGYNAHSGWWIAYAYSYMFRSMEDYLNFSMPNLVGFSGFRLTSGEQDLGEGFTKRDFESDGKKGIVFYKKYDTGDGNYIVSTYFASTNANDWDGSLGASAQYAAISLRCVSQLRPGTSGTNPSSSSSNQEVSLSERWTEAIMGYENVYDSDTGDHYQADTSSYWETGPDGPGYYKQSGNDLKKLERGFGNY